MWKQKLVWQKVGMFLSLLFLLADVTACSFTQSTFAITASNDGSAFAAAAAVLTYKHAGKVTSAYAESSFLGFQHELSGTDQTLMSQSGVDRRTLRHLLSLYTPAMQVVNAPCLSNACDWRKQITLLKNASAAFQEAGNS